jgi:perosamine synthetase
MSASKFIPLALPDLGGHEERYVVEAIRSTWIGSKGEYIGRFESEFSRLCGAESAVAVTNGTVGLHLCLLALDLRAGDEVIVPSLTYVAVANAVRYVGAVPVFVDVSPQTWCLDVDKIEANITRRTRGIIAVHSYGHPADMDEINRLASVYGLWVVEDAAEAHLARYKGRPVGGLGTLGVFSFFGNKIITSGEGGAITVSSKSLEDRLRMLRNQGVDNKRQYYFPIIGYNFRLTNIACAFLCAQIERVHDLVDRRRELFACYRRNLEGVPGLGLQPTCQWAEPAPWLFCLTVDETILGQSRDQVMTRLAESGVETRPFFIPIHTLPAYREESRSQGCDLPVTTRLSRQGLNLPTHTQLTEADIDYICGAIKSCAKA